MKKFSTSDMSMTTERIVIDDGYKDSIEITREGIRIDGKLKVSGNQIRALTKCKIVSGYIESIPNWFGRPQRYERNVMECGAHISQRDVGLHISICE